MRFNELLDKHATVLEENPAGSAKVGPMEVEIKPGWSHFPMKPPRRYSPSIEAAIKMHFQKQIDNVVIASDADYGVVTQSLPLHWQL